MYRELKENRPHGTQAYPYTQYFIHKPRRAFHIPVHWHDEVEIIFVKKGRVSISIQEEVFHAKPGDLFFVNSGELHFMESDDMSVEYYTILFPLEFISFQSEDTIEKEVFLPLRQKQLLFPTVPEEQKEQLIQWIEQMILVNEEKLAGYQLRTRILLLELVDFLLKEECFKTVDYANASSLQRDLIVFVQKHYTEKISLSMLAQEFHLSEKYVSWYFKEHFSISFMQYVVHLRMSKAKDMLVTTDLPITEVALSCGYPSVNLFIRNFKEMYNVTPLQYRKKTNAFT
ncbi:MAG: AraC family transcriptional regulator [Agathobacter sp.]|nr:AraC family transcriptional regulator [Agathobacter sp.]